MAGLKWTNYIWGKGKKKSKHHSGLWPFRKCFSVIINRDVSAQPIGFRDAIRIQMKRTPVLSLIRVYPFYLGTHSSLITMGQRSGGTKPCGWYSCKWERKASLFDFTGRKLGACRQSCICVKVGQNVPRSAPGALRGRRWTCLPSELLSVAVQLFFP